jgi:hypothetical protein
MPFILRGRTICRKQQERAQSGTSFDRNQSGIVNLEFIASHFMPLRMGPGAIPFLLYAWSEELVIDERGRRAGGPAQ